MTVRMRTYVTIAGIALLSAGAIFFARNDQSELLQAIASIPLAGSAVGVLVQILRDNAEYERTIRLQDAQNNFLMAAGSHMGEVAFDKYVAFSEAYIEEAHATLVTLMREGPSGDAVTHANALKQIREKFVLWLTPNQEHDLDPFEHALRKIGSQAHYVEAVRGREQDADQRGKAIESLFNTFAQVMGFPEWGGQPVTDELALASLIRKLRSILGTEAFMSLRTSLLTKVSSESQKG